MAITAFPVLARLLEDRHMLTTRLGILAMFCAALDDVVGWCVLACVMAIIHASSATFVAATLAFLALFIGIMLGVVRLLQLLAGRHLQSKATLMALTVIVLLLSAAATNAIGIHPVFGAFMAGLVLSRKAVFFELIQSIEQLNNLLFLPLYFVYNGLLTHIGLINSPALWLLCLVVLVVACLGEFLGGALPLQLFGASWKESFTLGTLMNTRGLVELIVLNIGLSLGVISPTFFALLVIMAVVTTMMTPPLLSLLGYRQSNARAQQQELASSEKQSERTSSSESLENL